MVGARPSMAGIILNSGEPEMSPSYADSVHAAHHTNDGYLY